MDLIDQQLRELEALDVPCTRREDFDDFWNETLQAVAETPLNVRTETVDYPIGSMEVRDLTFDALDGTAIRGWLLLPRDAKGPLPAVVSYHGQTGSRGMPSDHLQWVAMGAAVVACDYRMQGGLTGSNTGFAGGAGSLYFSTAGVLDPRTWYDYVTLVDGMRVLRVARECDRIDPKRICVNGGSQGGAMSLSAAALEPSVALCMADVPSRCWFERRVFDRAGGYGQIAEFLRRHPDRLDDVCKAVSYCDNINFAERIRCPVLVSVGLKDPVCPPPNVYAAYNKIRAPKEICWYPFGEHDGGGAVHNQKKLAFFAEHLLR